MLYSKIERHSALEELDKIQESKQINEFFGLFSLLSGFLFMSWWEKKEEEKKKEDGKSSEESKTDSTLEPAKVLSAMGDPKSDDDKNEKEWMLRCMFDDEGKELTPEESAEKMKDRFKNEDGEFDEESYNQFVEKQKNLVQNAKEDGTFDKMKKEVESQDPEKAKEVLEDARKKAVAIHKADKIAEDSQKKVDQLNEQKQTAINEATADSKGALGQESARLTKEKTDIDDEKESITKEEERLRQLYTAQGDNAKKIAEQQRDEKLGEVDEKLTEEAIKGRETAKTEEIKQAAQQAYDDAVKEPNQKIEECDSKLNGDDGLIAKRNAAENELNTFNNLSKEEKAQRKAEDPNCETNLKTKFKEAQSAVTAVEKEKTAAQKKISNAQTKLNTDTAAAENKAKLAVSKENQDLEKQKNQIRKEYENQLKEINKGENTTDPAKIEKRIQSELKERKNALKTRETQYTKDSAALTKKAENDPDLKKKIKEINDEFDGKIKTEQQEAKEKVESTRKEAGLPPQPPKNPEDKTQTNNTNQETGDETKTNDGDETGEKKTSDTNTNEPKELTDDEVKSKYKQLLKDAGKSDEEVETEMNKIKDKTGEELDNAIEQNAKDNNVDIDDLETAEEEESKEDEDDDNGGKSKTKFRKIKKKTGRGMKFQRWSVKNNEWVPATKQEYNDWKQRQNQSSGGQGGQGGGTSESIQNFVKPFLEQRKIRSLSNFLKR